MIYELKLSAIVPQMTGATTQCCYAAPGDALKMGSKLVDLSVDLSSAFAQECPPVSYYRIVLREPAFLRAITAKPGDFTAVDAPLALFSSTPDEPLDEAPARPVRVTVAGIMHHDAMWSGQQE
ncbi:MAG: hypothetical protein FP826_14305 [Sphingomonadales bacterium]|nr:hypothetical protein [Sphingomonadales bacterium]MBU3993571.1 hypothetical protein [Alphaproteobacteria bacterium]